MLDMVGKMLDLYDKMLEKRGIFFFLLDADGGTGLLATQNSNTTSF